MPDNIAAFARAALARAQTALQTAPLSALRVAGINIAVAETAPRVIPWGEGQFDPPDGPATARIYCDYSGSHLQAMQALGDISAIPPLELDDALAKAGLFGTFNPAQNHWDLFDPASGTGLRLLPGPDAYPVWEPTAPMANILGWIMRANGRMVMHAAALGIDGNGVLLAGAGGSGKSGTTLAGVAGGLQSVGDDYCVISQDPDPVARPLYRMMKQDSAGLARTGLQGDFGPLNWQGKHVFDLRRIFPEAAVDRITLKAVLLPRIRHTPRSRLEPVSPFAALQALAPSTMLQLGGDRAATFKACAALVRRLPAYHLLLGEDPQEIAATIAGFITEGAP